MQSTDSESKSKNYTVLYSGLLSDIEKGQIKIPQFQRDFVWEIRKSASLIDSIVKGYPIGSFIFWRTNERLRSIRNIGNQELPPPREGEFVDYVIDGQQRITTLFAALKGLKVEKEDGKIEDFNKIYIDLEADENNDEIVIIDTDKRDPQSVISIKDLLYGSFDKLADYPKRLHEKIKRYKHNMESYPYSVIEFKNAPIDIATLVFTRVNVGGKHLSLFEIMVAKTFDQDRNFDLAEKYSELQDRLKPINYETISDATVLQTVSIILRKECTRKVILALDKDSFVNEWEKTVDAIERAVEFFKYVYRIPVSQLLPYSTLVVPFAYYFYHHPDKPKGEIQKYLQDFFWHCALSGRYSSGVESKLAQDVKRIDVIMKGELPKYDWSIDTSAKFILQNGWFSAGRSYIKAILCIYAYHQPKSYNDNASVNISNDWLKQANSKNYHHFFPKKYLKSKGVERIEYNSIVNISIVDDFLNKREIKTSPPSEYLKRFQRENPQLSDTMKTHLINDLEKFGVWNDDYKTFLAERAKVISKELEKRIIKQEIDNLPQPELEDDSSDNLADFGL